MNEKIEVYITHIQRDCDTGKTSKRLIKKEFCSYIETFDKIVPLVESMDFEDEYKIHLLIYTIEESISIIDAYQFWKDYEHFKENETNNP